MEVCYGIIAHRDTAVLNNTINLLTKDDKVILHVDAKSDINNFKKYSSKVSIIEDRVDVKWGTFSQIECMLKLINEAIKQKFDYFFLISGDDMPIKNSMEIKKILKRLDGKEFIGVQRNIDVNDLIVRVKYNYKEKHFKKNKNLAEKVAIRLERKLGLIDKNQYYTKLPKLYKGSNWFGISYECCQYILNYVKENKWYLDSFRNSLCGDEVFFQTLIMNSPFKDKIYMIDEPDNNYDDNYMSLRYIDWKSGPDFPRILDESDFQKIKSKENLIFARKFDDNINIEKFNKQFNDVKV